MFEKPDQRVEFVKMPKALEKAKGILAESRIKMEDFSDLYGEETLAEDREKLAQREASFTTGRGVSEVYEGVNKDLATIFEAMIFDQGERSKWFGDRASLVAASRYDDVINGVDLVVEWDQNGGVSRMAAGIDVTFNHDVQKKISSIKRSILENDLGVIKYFKSKVSKIRGEISEIPRIILGADVDTVRELTNEWASNNTRVLEKHPVQFQFFDEAISQCHYFIDFAERNNQPRIADAYSDLLRVLQFQYDKKTMSLGADPKIRDSFYRDSQTFFKLEQ
jgi:hypothetical protein